MRYIALPLLLLCGLSCSSSPTSAQPQARSSALQGPVILRIAGRHEDMVIRAGASGPTYSLESKDGSVLLAAMTLDELAVNNPQMFQTINTMQADACLFITDDR